MKTLNEIISLLQTNLEGIQCIAEKYGYTDLKLYCGLYSNLLYFLASETEIHANASIDNEINCKVLLEQFFQCHVFIDHKESFTDSFRQLYEQNSMPIDQCRNNEKYHSFVEIFDEESENDIKFLELHEDPGEDNDIFGATRKQSLTHAEHDFFNKLPPIPNANDFFPQILSTNELYEIALRYRYGWDCQKDNVMCSLYLQKAAAQGHGPSRSLLEFVHQEDSAKSLSSIPHGFPLNTMENYQPKMKG